MKFLISGGAGKGRVDGGRTQAWVAEVGGVLRVGRFEEVPTRALKLAGYFFYLFEDGDGEGLGEASGE
jgi:hypothetical protein